MTPTVLGLVGLAPAEKEFDGVDLSRVLDPGHDLKTVIDYLYSEESKHYEDEGQPKDHVFVSVLGLQEIHLRNSRPPLLPGDIYL